MEQRSPLGASGSDADSGGREKLRAMLRAGKLDERTVELSVQGQAQIPMMEVFSGQGMDDLESSLSGLAGIFGGGKKKKVVTVKLAKEILLAEES